MWDEVRNAAAPPGLKRKIDMFSARAIVPLRDDESFQEQSWAALLLGSGVVPQGYDPRVDSIPDAMHVQRVQQRLRDVASLARQMPVVEQFLGLEQRSSALVSG
jgi:tryptophan halogenase